MYVDINSYGMALDENNNAIFDVDQAINIVDVKNKTSTSIGFFGSVGRVEDAFWKDNSTIVLLGSINYPKSSPFVTIVDLKNKTEKQYSYKNSEWGYGKHLCKGLEKRELLAVEREFNK